MPTRTPIPVSRAMRQISANLDLARRQQRIPAALLAERAGLSMPTVTKMLRTGNGSFENFLRIARLLDCWTAYSKRRTLLTQYRQITRRRRHSETYSIVQQEAQHIMEAIVTLQFNGTDVTVGKLFTSIRRGIESAHFTYDTAYMRSSNAVSLCPEMPLSPGTFPAEHNAMHRIFQDCMPDRWGRNLMLRAEHQDARSEHRTARTLFEGDLLLSVNDETRQGALRFWNNDGDELAPSETGVPREVTIQSRIHSNDEQLL